MREALGKPAEIMTVMKVWGKPVLALVLSGSSWRYQNESEYERLLT